MWPLDSLMLKQWEASTTGCPRSVLVQIPGIDGNIITVEVNQFCVNMVVLLLLLIPNQYILALLDIMVWNTPWLEAS